MTPAPRTPRPPRKRHPLSAPRPARPDEDSPLDRIAAAVEACRRCPRLVDWREEVAAVRRPANADEVYWGRPLAGWGDPEASLVVVGLAPAAHGGNRTGRMFTGDRSGDFLFSALHRAGYANQPGSDHRDDGLRLSGAYVTAAVRCAPPANRPTPAERDECLGYLAEELRLLGQTRVLLALGAFAYDALGRVPRVRAARLSERWPRFAHLAEAELAGGTSILCSYHPSQRNVFTGLLTPAMMDSVLARARSLGA
jgi:uracil-DNA glycosylase family 4